MNLLKTLPLCLTVLILGLNATMVRADDDEKEISLDIVPKKVLKAAEIAVKGIKITEAEVEEEDGRLVYELEGTLDGKEYEIEVTEDGKVIEIESGDDDDNEGDKDDDDDKDKKKDKGKKDRKAKKKDKDDDNENENENDDDD